MEARSPAPPGGSPGAGQAAAPAGEGARERLTVETCLPASPGMEARAPASAHGSVEAGPAGTPMDAEVCGRPKRLRTPRLQLRRRYDLPSARRLIGKRVRVFWDEDGKWYAGVVKAFSEAMMLHTIVYDDKQQVSVDLISANARWEEIPQAARITGQRKSRGGACAQRASWNQSTPLRSKRAAPSCPSSHSRVAGARAARSRPPSTWLAPRRTCTRVGEDYQVDLPPELTPSIRAPPAPPPRCRCDLAATWEHGRWWCAEDACGYEAEVPTESSTPRCLCGDPTVWQRGRWWCAADGGGEGHTSARAGGCGYSRPPIAPTLRDGELISTAEIDCEMARSTTALLNAGAHGPVADFVFVAPCDIGVGLFARTKLVPGQAPPPVP